MNPGEDLPVLQSKLDGTDSSTISQQTNTSWSRLQHILDDPTLAISTAEESVKPNVPHMIHTQPFTYAAAVNPPQSDSIAHQTSAISSPTNSRTTITSAKAQEIETKLDLLTAALAALQTKQEQPPPPQPRNTELEDKVERLFTMQLEIIDRLNNMAPPTTSIPQQPPPYVPPADQKRKEIPSPHKAATNRGKHTSNAGTDREIPIPPNPATPMDTSQEASPHQGVQQNIALQNQPLEHQHIPVSDPHLYGNINDDDITEEMYSQEAPEQSPPEPPNHRVARSKGNKAKKC